MNGWFDLISQQLLTSGGLLAQSPPLLWPYKLPALVFAFCFGACVGSFLNVVVYRLPEGISIISPPSRCPTCGARLSWRENFPILGWLLLRGKCKSCGVNISPQYMIIELFVALLFVGFTLVYFVVFPSAAYWGQIASPWWYYQGVKALPAFIAVLVLFSALVGMTMIDARTFTIPIELPNTVVLVAIIAFPVQTLLAGHTGTQAWPMPLMNWTWVWCAGAGVVGIGLSMVLLRMGVIRYSFADYEEYLPKSGSDAEAPREPNHGLELLVRIGFYIPPALGVLIAALSGGSAMTLGLAAGGGFILSALLAMLGLGDRVLGDQPDHHQPEALAEDYPHARREMFVELLFLVPCLVLMMLTWILARQMTGTPPLFLQALAGVMVGYMVGGGLVWVIRILGTLGFGREAMGMGDVHLLGAVGAVLGWIDPIFIFFAAAFVGLAWAVPGFFLRKLRSELPYGPHLAVATLLVVMLHPVIYPGVWGQIVAAWGVAGIPFP